ncbi:MAG: tRNA (adenosine(37)-N6)-threonylcarbamoyltransferase complex ATPase subunit type 1 TsaE [Bacteroidia bacterium]|nr:tRNA (adenosine(37)-N6)-threonylcarbamoyltransferase complex ATPase subunit type 1 TsaE [Bacteroidia bacterium]MDW8332954.1 tRNA (adenosine(37)-N6)-threonylcarbamoyltransferase complex ATPase subunit type 1 TsaE [Bacteroidia bacterium]
MKTLKIEYKLDRLTQTAAKVWELRPRARVFGFYGELGVGKTTLIRAMLGLQGVSDPVPSPTFALVQTYLNRFHHMDLYRLKSYDEFCRAGLDELLYSGVGLVEWPQILEGKMPMVKINLEYASQADARVLYICDDNLV